VDTSRTLPALAAAFFAGSPHFERLALRCLKQLRQNEQPGRIDARVEQVTRLISTLRASAPAGMGTAA
jgi:hypothetical protein